MADKKLDELLRDNTSAIQLYRPNLANPQAFDDMRMWVQRELDNIQAGFASTDEVVKILAKTSQDIMDRLESASGAIEVLAGKEGPQGPQGPQGPPGDDADADRRTRWRGQWDQSQYEAFDQVNDDGWLMIANKPTTDHAAPAVVGQPFYPYQGTLTGAQVSAKQIIFGSRYTLTGDGYIGAYRIYVYPDQTYEVYFVVDPLGTPIVDTLASYTSTTEGWITFTVPPRFLPSGLEFDLVAVTVEPDPAPVTVQAPYDYNTPQNPAVPASGAIQHSRSQSDVMAISYTDDLSNDRTALLQNLALGDTIVGAGSTWTVQSTADQGTYINVVVTPAAVGSPTGVQVFDFNTNAPQLTDYGLDTDYWLTSPFSVQGLLGIDTDYQTIVPDDTAYGVDVFVQAAIVSEDWDFQAYTDSISGGNEARLTSQEVEWVQANSEFFQIGDLMTTDNTWTSLGSVTIPVDEGFMASAAITGRRTDGFGIYHAEYRATVWNDGGVVSQDTTVQHEASTNPALDVRLEVVGSTVEFQVRGASSQDWHWRGILFDRRIE